MDMLNFPPNNVHVTHTNSCQTSLCEPWRPGFFFGGGRGDQSCKHAASVDRPQLLRLHYPTPTPTIKNAFTGNHVGSINYLIKQMFTLSHLV